MRDAPSEAGLGFQIWDLGFPKRGTVMGYEVIARKWRPRQFDEVVGQDHVIRTLKNAITTGRIAHAYLFVGPRGIGKTSMARILAKALNCEKGPAVKPCDVCVCCREIASGTDLDVLEYDAASNTQVDKIRELIIGRVQYAPTRGRFTIYIVDEVHMLSAGSFNALLKTLEEPPPHVKFIFATTEPDKVPATILSRCQRFDLRRIPTNLIVDRLRQIAKAEKVQADDDALLAIARVSEGGLRDAESALDQIVSFQGNRVSEEDILTVFGLVARGALERLTETILRGDVPGLIRQVAALDEAGKDLQRLTVELMGQFRNLLVCLHVGDAPDLLDATDAQIQILRAQAALTTPGRAMRVAEILAETEERMKYALSRRTLLETSLIRCARAATVVSIEEILTRINALRQGLPEETEDGRRKTEPAAAEETGDGSRKTEPAEDEGEEPAEPPEPSESAPPPPAENRDLAALRARWGEVVERAGRLSLPIRSTLADTRPVGVRGDVVTLAVDPEFAKERQSYDVSRSRKAVDMALSEVLGRTVQFTVTVGREATPGAAAPAEEPASPAAPESASSAPKTAGKRRTREELAKDPAVRRTLELFEGGIAEIR
jgi:DNA polymerase-3 subunit gamma/tau